MQVNAVTAGAGVRHAPGAISAGAMGKVVAALVSGRQVAITSQALGQPDINQVKPADRPPQARCACGVKCRVG